MSQEWKAIKLVSGDCPDPEDYSHCVRILLMLLQLLVKMGWFNY